MIRNASGLVRGLLAISWLLGASIVHGEQYSVSLTRQERNLYKVEGQEVLVLTSHCYVDARNTKAVLSDDKVRFVDAGETCPVKMILADARMLSGEYDVRVTDVGDDMYATSRGTHIRTWFCNVYARGEEAVLKVQAFNSELSFVRSRHVCTVKGVYERIRLR
jgi:hypothetical protein